MTATVRWLALVASVLALATCTRPPVSSPRPPAEVAPPTETAASPSPASPPVVFAVKGDWGAGTRAQHDVTSAMCAAREEFGFRVVVTTGDNFYRPDGEATPQNFFEPEQCLLSAGIEWRASWGNHDRRGTSTGRELGAEHTYRWKVDDVEFFVLDSNSASSGEQTIWLDEGLGSSKARVKIAVFHHPPYTVGSEHPPDRRVLRNWVPLFREHGVALVLTGHNHLYEHSVADGIHYVVSGGGGAELYRCADESSLLIRCTEAHHFLVVEVSQRRILVRAIAPTGEAIDRFAIPLEE
ncbi:MAG: metallophosphoesterase family protein [Actinomycetota bacterium]